MFGVGTQKKDDVIAMDARKSSPWALQSLVESRGENQRELKGRFFLSLLFIIWDALFFFLFSRVVASF